MGQAGLPPGGGVVAATGQSLSRPAAIGSGVGPALYGPASYGRKPFMPAGASSAPYEPVANGPMVNGPVRGLNNGRAGGNRYLLPAGNASVAAAGPVNAPVSARPGGVGRWTGAVPPPVGPIGTTGWATGLPEQARGTSHAVTAFHPVANPAVRFNVNPFVQQNAVGNAVGGAVQALPIPHEVVATVGGAVQALPVQDVCAVAGGGYAPQSLAPRVPVVGPLVSPHLLLL